MKPLSPPKTAPTGIVQRIDLPGQMLPVKVEPLSDAEVNPYYAKLRVEADAVEHCVAMGKCTWASFWTHSTRFTGTTWQIPCISKSNPTMESAVTPERR